MSQSQTAKDRIVKGGLGALGDDAGGGNGCGCDCGS
jgi:hypothetical protein